MGKSAAATTVVERAAQVVACWKDLYSVHPHELRAHLVFERLLRALWEARGLPTDWYLTAPFWVPVGPQTLHVVVLVGNVGEDVRAIMREGRLEDMTHHHPARELRAQLERGEEGALRSWELWTNAYFLNGIRDALFSIGPTAIGDVWTSQDGTSGNDALKGAREALAKSQTRRSRLVIERAHQLSVRIPPQNIPLEKLRGRNPPAGLRRKGKALTLTEQLVLYLRQDLGMNASDAAIALGMQDLRQVVHAEQSAARKKESWKDVR